MGTLVHKRGSIFASELQGWAHGVNVDGLMGAGLAKTVKLHYPEVYELYRDACDDGLNGGDTVVVRANDGTYSFNLASQERPGAHARFSWLRKSAEGAIAFAEEEGLDGIAFPMIGAGIGGLNPEKVEKLLEELADSTALTLELWKYPN